MLRHGPIVTLLTDFGDRDGYVAQMKGVMLSILPTINFVDISHHVPPQNVLIGALLLRNTFPTFPDGTIHLAVVDPGVGTDRRVVAVQVGQHWLVGPDNGLLSLVAVVEKIDRAVAIENSAIWRHPVSRTFHGRDIMAPAAAHLAKGAELAELGPPIDELVRLQPPEPIRQAGKLVGQILCVDHFGNIMLSLPAQNDYFGARDKSLVTFSSGGVEFSLPFVETYSDVPPGQLMLLEGSQGFLEIAARDGAANQMLRLREGAQITLSIPSGQ